jgi:uncharacterized membrane protein
MGLDDVPVRAPATARRRFQSQLMLLCGKIAEYHDLLKWMVKPPVFTGYMWLSDQNLPKFTEAIALHCQISQHN